ncbi:MAG: hypothetical protein JXB14_02910 [Candidatus Altiarchaeota archaeon]|nr:hypothetical protein [Candidatus Altiarchaeota archaeon]
MKTRGFESGPFQLFIAVIIMMMSLIVGFYLINMVNCWKCEEMGRTEATDFKEKIANVGDGDVGSVAVVNLELPECIKGFFIRKILGNPGEGKCKSFCPQHPDQCWVFFGDSRCSGRYILECIDIAGDTDMNVDSTLAVASNNPNDEWIDTAYAFTSKSYLIRIYKSTPNTIDIGKP